MIFRLICCITLILVLTIFGCSGPQDEQVSVEYSGVINVMTFNIRYGTANDKANHWKNRRDLVVDVIYSHKPDFAGLQEALDFQVEYIAQAMPEYDVYYVGRDDGVKAGESCAILYLHEQYKLADFGTFWFSDTPSKPSADWGNTCLRICSWVRLINKSDGRGIYVYNLHLDHESQNSREKSTHLLAERISQRKHPDPYVIMGDFNMTVDNPAMKYLLVDGFDTFLPQLVSAWQVSNSPDMPNRTYHNFSGETSGLAIDHILVEENIPVIKAEIDTRSIDGRYPSDHYPVAVTIKLY